MHIDSETLLALLRARVPAGASINLPPPCLVEMAAQPLDWQDGVSLTLRFPVQERWRNPLGFMQGGFIAAALDNTIGPFSYLIAPPSVTSQLNLSYLRPVSPQATNLTCTARLVERTTKTLYIAGEARTDDGKIAVLAQAVCQVL